MSHGEKEPKSNDEVSSRPESHSSKARKTISSRIAASATGLAKGFGSGPSAQGSSATLDSSLSGLSSKTQHGSSSTDHAAWNEVLPRRLPKLTSDENQSAPGAVQQSFRTVNNTESIRNEFHHFQEDEHIYSNTKGLSQDQMWSTQFEKGFPQNAAAISTISTGSNARHFTGLPPDYKDGAEIVRLLSGPGFLDSVDESDKGFDDLEDSAYNGLFDEPMSAIESQISDRIRSTLPTPPHHQRVSPNLTLSLRSSAESISPVSEEAHQCTQTSTQPLHEKEDKFSKVSQQSATQRELFLAEWENVLHNYADEVWGHMLPVVKSTRRQISDARTGTASLDGQVVARLRMILGHMTENGLRHPNRDADETPQRYNITADSSARDNAPDSDPMTALHDSWRIDNSRSSDDQAGIQLDQEYKSLLACPHAGCERLFQTRKEWAKHYQGAHQSISPPTRSIDT